MNDNLEYNHVPYSSSYKFAIYHLSDKGIEQYTKDSLTQKIYMTSENKLINELLENGKKSNVLQENNSLKNMNFIDDFKKELKFQTDQKEIKLPVREKEINLDYLNDTLKRVEKNPQYLYI